MVCHCPTMLKFPKSPNTVASRAGACACLCEKWRSSQPHRAVKDHTVSVAQALDVGCQVEADGSMADGVHSLSVEEVVRSGYSPNV